MLMRIAGWLVTAFGVFLMLDSILAVALGKRYMLWGLEYTPDMYRALIEKLSAFPPAVLLGVKLGEGAIGLMLFWLAGKIRH